MKQTSFSDLAYEHKKKTTRKERFLGEWRRYCPGNTEADNEEVSGAGQTRLIFRHPCESRNLMS